MRPLACIQQLARLLSSSSPASSRHAHCRYAYTVDEPGEHYGRKMYRSPLFPDLKIFSAEQLRHHMLTKKYKRAERQQKESGLSAEQLKALREKKAERRARKEARKAAGVEPTSESTEGPKKQATSESKEGQEKKTSGTATAASTEGHSSKKNSGKTAPSKSRDLSEEQIAAAKAKFAAKKARRLARKNGAGDNASVGDDSLRETKKRPQEASEAERGAGSAKKAKTTKARQKKKTK